MGVGQAVKARRGGRTPSWLGPTALVVVSAFFVGVVVWGYFFPEEIKVEYFDVGPADTFVIGHLQSFPEEDIYIVGLPDGRLRAIDSRIEGTDCAAVWLPDDPRGMARNPDGDPGVFHDACSGAIWSVEGNAIEGTIDPLRTPYIDYRLADDGLIHAFVERVNP